VSLGPRKGHAYFLNRKYPAYEAIVAYGRRIAQDYPTPKWDSVEVAISKQNVLFRKGRNANYSKRKSNYSSLSPIRNERATPLQIKTALNVPSNADAKRTFAMLTDLGTVTELCRGKKIAAYVLDPRFRYAHELRSVLEDMLWSTLKSQA
jgi:hypothetical protein